MSIEVMSLVWKHAPLEGNDLIVLLALADWAHDDGVSWHSVRELARKSRTSERTVQRCLATLRERNFLGIEYREPAAHETSVYHINLDKSAWKSGPRTPGDNLSPGDTADTSPGDTGDTLYVSRNVNNQSLSNAHAQSSFVDGPPSAGTGKKVPGTGNSRAVGGKQKMDLTLPPTKYRVSTEMWEWAVRAGWRASREDLQFTADTCFDHFRGKGEARADWIATLRTWVSRNIEEGKDLKIMQRRSTIQNIENASNASSAGNGGSNGRAGPGPGSGQDRPRYGYNRAGEPTNRSTAIIETARSLARTQAARELETGGPEYVETQRVREDRLRDSAGPGEQLRGDIDESDR